MTDNTFTFDKFALRNWLGLALIVVGVALFFIVNNLIVPTLNLSVVENAELNNMFLYQGVMLILTLIFLALLFVLFSNKFRTFARLGDLRADPDPVEWLAIGEKDTWLNVGITFAVIVSVATSIFMFTSIEGDLSRLNLGYLGIVLILALSNSFIEEAIIRFGVVVNLYGIVPDRYVAIVSGLIFGIPHYFGTPGGPVGAVMALFMGWFLAKSVIETRGIFWAWFIHFLQDVIIFFVLVSTILG